MTRTMLVLALLLSQPLAARAADLAVDGAFSRATPGTGPGVAYVTIHGGDVADRLIGVASPRAAAVEVHVMSMDGPVMRMRQAPVLDVPAGTTVTLAPNGTHLMLLGLKAPLKQGETVPLVLTFEKAGERRVNAPVGPIGAGMPPMPGMGAHTH